MNPMSKYFHNHCDCNCHKPQYIVLFCGDDSNFVGNQKIFIELETDIDTTGCKAHLRYINKTFTWNAIPEDKRLELVFSAEETKAMPLGDWDAELWLEDAQGRRRTVSNQIRIRVTKSVGDAYWSEDPQSIKASIGNAFDYNNAYNKPRINGHTLSGDSTLGDIGVDQSMIFDAAGNVIRADGSSVVVDGSWTCNGVLLTKKEGRDDYWENADKKWGLGYIGDSRWSLVIVGTGNASTTAPADATKLSFVIGDVTYDATIGRADSVVMAGDVVPKGNGTETIATIGWKDIKAPASPVSSVNGKTGAVKLVAQDVGAFPASGGEVGSAESAGVIRLAATYFNAPVLEFKQSFSDASALNIPNSAMYEQTGEGPMASIKKGGKEVATEASIATEYSPSSSYSVGAFVFHDGNIYQCRTAIADGGEEWNAAHWELRKLDDFFTESNSLLVGTIKANAGGDDEKMRAVFSTFARMDDFTTVSDESDSFDIAITKLSQLLGEDVAA